MWLCDVNMVEDKAPVTFWRQAVHFTVTKSWPFESDWPDVSMWIVSNCTGSSGPLPKQANLIRLTFRVPGSFKVRGGAVLRPKLWLQILSHSSHTHPRLLPLEDLKIQHLPSSFHHLSAK
jgi:hypothetical protein